MHSHLSEVFALLEDSRTTLRQAVDGVPPNLRRERPEAGRWSVAEVLEHLALVNRFFAQRIADAIAEARAAGLGVESHAREGLAAGVVESMANRGHRREAREAVMPTGAVDADTAWDDLDQAREAVRAAAAGGDGLALGSVRVDHRLFGSLTLYQWVELTAAHEVRHADQIREVGAALRR
jgi:DinB superfamily